MFGDIIILNTKKRSKKPCNGDRLPVKHDLNRDLRYNKIMAKPFIKWVGGKTQLLAEISGKYPQKIEK